jgi:low affinity Fe/Cu permease
MSNKRRRDIGIGRGLETFARRVTEWAGSSWVFGSAVGVIVIWMLTRPFFHFSDTWQLVINTATTIVTFLLVFLIQRSRNKDSLAVHLKLNEIVAALEEASNRLINVEELTEEEVRTLRQHYRRLVEIAKREESLTRSHSIAQAARRQVGQCVARQPSVTTARTGRCPPGATNGI